MANHIPKAIADGKVADVEVADGGGDAKANPIATFRGWMLNFLTAGGQFIVLGSILLLIANYMLQNEGANTVLIFVFVVLGSAVFLFGTGTQGTGSFNNGVTDARITASIAGGAGVMSLLIGYGMVQYEPVIRQVFSAHPKGLYVKFERSEASPISLRDVRAEFRNSLNEILLSKVIADEYIVLLNFNGSLDSIASKKIEVQLFPKDGILLDKMHQQLTLPEKLDYESPDTSNQFYVLKTGLKISLLEKANKVNTAQQVEDTTQIQSQNGVLPNSAELPAGLFQ